MKQLFEIDLKDYEDDFCVFRRPSARAIIINFQAVEYMREKIK